MAKNTKIISLSVDPETHKKLQKVAIKKGIGMSELFRYMVDKFPIHKDDVQLIVLQIPKEKMMNKADLTQWFSNAYTKIVNQIFS